MGESDKWQVEDEPWVQRIVGLCGGLSFFLGPGGFDLKNEFS